MTFYNKVKYQITSRITPYTAQVEDYFADRALAPKLDAFRETAAYKAIPSFRILVVGVQSARRPGSLDRIYGEMASERHEITFDIKGVDNLGKLDNTNVLLARHNLEDFDWIFMVDDDVNLPERFTDTFLALSEFADLKVAGPAQRSYSYWSHQITRRQRGVLVRQTNYAEVGPILALRKEMFDLAFPLPSLKYGWGVDLVIPDLAEQRGWKTGIVDGAALRHNSPMAATYNYQAAVEEYEAYVANHGIDLTSFEFRTFRTVSDIA